MRRLATDTVPAPSGRRLEPQRMTRPAPTLDPPDCARPTASRASTDTDDLGWSDELAAVFAAELQEHLNHVPALAALLASPDTQSVACAKLSRIFHTIKGSAAVVGRDELAALAKRLQDEFGAVAELPAQHALPADFLTSVQAALDDLYTAAGQTAPQLLHPVLASPVELQDSSSAIATDQEPADLLHAFEIDATAAIEGSQRLLLDLERRPGDTSVLRQLFRHFHTLKGAAAAVGLEQVTEQLHHGESLLEAALEGRIAGDTSRLVDFLLRLTDSLAGLINTARGVADHRHAVLDDVEAQVTLLLAPASGAAPPTTFAPHATPPSDDTARVADSDATTLRVESAHLDALLDHVGQLLGARNRMHRRVETLNELRDQLTAQRALLLQIIDTFREKYEFSVGPPEANGKGVHTTADASKIGRAADVELDRYDDVSILARGIVELAAHSQEITEQLRSAIDALGDESALLSQITSALRHGVTRLRSVPLDHVLRRLVRAVRDGARQEEKLVELQLDGGTLELDKSLVDRVHAPLLHLVRNAVSHGIELPAVRQARGKPPTGTVRVAAALQDRTLHLSVEDDGAGIDFAAVATRGHALGIVSAAQPWSRDELLSLLFRPGFSTRQAITDLCGRGVGMDAVAADIRALNGSITIDSHDGHGTTVRVALPITTSIDEVLLVQCGAQLFALPVGLVDQVVPVDVSDLLRRTPRTVVVRNGVLPALVLAPFVGEPAPMDSASAVVLRTNGGALALVVDRVQAQHEAVIRPLGPVLESHPLLAGAVVSGTGAVILVLHVARLVDLAASVGDQADDRAADDVCGVGASRGEAVLFVDDSISVRKVAAHFLESSGLEVATAVDGLDAVEKLATGRFCIVVTDLEMPRMHGYELIGAMRRHPHHHHLPVIVCSSRSSDKHRARAYEMGAQGYLTKPFTKEQLLTEIQRLSGLTPEHLPLTDIAPGAAQ
jgi:chemotaxis protein histidine kinase CheA/ActR/RegA family two-component response regulator